MARARKKVHRNTRLNPFTGKREPIKKPQRSSFKARAVMGSVAISGLRKRRTTPGAPLPFSYGYERVYRKAR